MRPHVFLVLLVIQQVVFAAGNVPNATSNPVKVSVLGPEHVALVINDADANSVQIGEYYRLARNIPAKNIVHVNIPKARTKLTFQRVLNRSISTSNNHPLRLPPIRCSLQGHDSSPYKSKVTLLLPKQNLRTI